MMWALERGGGYPATATLGDQPGSAKNLGDICDFGLCAFVNGGRLL